jgi:hypothetical protein
MNNHIKRHSKTDFNVRLFICINPNIKFINLDARKIAMMLEKYMQQ